MKKLLLFLHLVWGLPWLLVALLGKVLLWFAVLMAFGPKRARSNWEITNEIGDW